MKQFGLTSGVIAFAAALLLIFRVTPVPVAAVALQQASLSAGAPGLLHYQGFLSDGAGNAYSGEADFTFAVYAASSGGSALWQEIQSNVAVGEGFFNVLLGSVTPLTAEIFDGTERYLEVTVDLGAGSTTLPRQRLAAVPYAFQAAAVPWDGISGVPADFADGVDDSGAAYENVITVAQSGADYSSVAAALNSIGDASETNRYLVWVAPGVYSETDLASVQAYVHLKGSGANTTVISSARTNTVQNDSAATVRLYDNGRISALTIRNTGSGTFGIGIWSAEATRGAVIKDAVIEAVGSGGTGHFAIYLSDSEPTISDSVLRAGGAVGGSAAVNTALGSVNNAGGFPQPLIERSILIGGNNDPNGKTCAGNSGTGYGIQYTNSAPEVSESYVCGDYRSIFGGVAGITRVIHSQLAVSSSNGAFLLETTGSVAITIANSGVFYNGNKHSGTGNITCANSYGANYAVVSDGNNVATACN
ncbi:MAG: hypothetical protein HC822_21125 [Oscillochloris sp.]|nr:hypothetical protein [Oscillochloris sp.]